MTLRLTISQIHNDCYALTYCDLDTYEAAFILIDHAELSDILTMRQILRSLQLKMEDIPNEDSPELS